MKQICGHLNLHRSNYRTWIFTMLDNEKENGGAAIERTMFLQKENNIKMNTADLDQALK